jgi:hypothetical protein
MLERPELAKRFVELAEREQLGDQSAKIALLERELSFRHFGDDGVQIVDRVDPVGIAALTKACSWQGVVPPLREAVAALESKRFVKDSLRLHKTIHL